MLVSVNIRPPLSHNLSDRGMDKQNVPGKLVKLAVFNQGKSQRICDPFRIVPSYLLNEAWPGSCELGAALEPAGAWLLIAGAGGEYSVDTPFAGISLEAIAARYFTNVFSCDSI
jgi:hypothetical protein